MKVTKIDRSLSEFLEVKEEVENFIRNFPEFRLYFNTLFKDYTAHVKKEGFRPSVCWIVIGQCREIILRLSNSRQDVKNQTILIVLKELLEMRKALIRQMDVDKSIFKRCYGNRGKFEKLLTDYPSDIELIDMFYREIIQDETLVSRQDLGRLFGLHRDYVLARAAKVSAEDSTYEVNSEINNFRSRLFAIIA